MSIKVSGSLQSESSLLLLLRTSPEPELSKEECMFWITIPEVLTESMSIVSSNVKTIKPKFRSNVKDTRIGLVMSCSKFKT